mmetsp:Transcript_10628/g.16116  ORF Transcript_10628/g.16116 Transcript_10628/m.16116 type:complete len:132 (-) Transcript_10628:65-460(-)
MENWRSNNKADNRAMKLDIQSAPVKMGNAAVRHQDVWHGSGPNTSVTRHRRALVGHCLRGDVKVDSSDSDSYDRFRQPFGKTSYICMDDTRGIKVQRYMKHSFQLFTARLGQKGGKKEQNGSTTLLHLNKA